MFLGFAAENNLSFDVIPGLVNLCKSASTDKRALSRTQLSRVSASYKMTHGLGRYVDSTTHDDLKHLPFSLNLDECTSTNNKKVLCKSYLLSLNDRHFVYVFIDCLKVSQLSKMNSICILAVLAEFEECRG